MFEGEEMSENKNPLVGVIIPNYNNEKYLADCVESVLSQTYTPIEIIIVDDCSTDGSKEIINSFLAKSKKIRPIYLPINKGVSNARNIGARESLAKYITFLDSDDFYMSPLKLENEMKLLLQKEKQERRVAVFSKLCAVDAKGDLLWNYRTKKYFSGRRLRRYILEESEVQLPRDYCMKRQWFLEAGQYEYGSHLYEDLEFLFRLSEEVEFLCTEQVGSAYRITNQGLSSVGVERHRDALKRLRKKCFPQLTIFDKTKVCVMLACNRSISRMKRLAKTILGMIGLRK